MRRNLKTAVQAVVIQELKPDRARDESSASKEWAGLLQSPKVEEYLQGVRSLWDAKIKKSPPIGLIGSAPSLHNAQPAYLQIDHPYRP